MAFFFYPKPSKKASQKREEPILEQKEVALFVHSAQGGYDVSEGYPGTVGPRELVGTGS